MVAASYGQWQAPPGSVSLTTQLDQRLTILEERGFVDGWRMTEAGPRSWPRSTTSRICWSPTPSRQGVFDGLDPAALAGVASALYLRGAGVKATDARARGQPVGRRAAGPTRRPGRLPPGRRAAARPPPDPAARSTAWPGRWSPGPRGQRLDSVLRETEVAPGDFVRNVRQLIDLLRQLAQAAPQTRGPGTPPAWPCSSSAGAWSEPTTRPRWGPRLGRPARRSVIRACSPMSWRRSAPTRKTSSAATSPTWTSRSLPWSTCLKWSREPCSPGTPGRPRACAGCSSTSSSASSTSPGTPRVDATVGLARAEELYERVFFEYGDDSVAQLGGVHLACEQASNVLTKVLEWGRLMAYLEQSTRYIAYDHRPTIGPLPLLPGSGAARLAARGPLRGGHGPDVRHLRRAAGVEPRPGWPSATRARPGDSDFVHRQAVRAKALDALRGLLPAGLAVQRRHLRNRAVLRAAAAAHAVPSAPRGPTLRRADAGGAAQGHPLLPPAGGPPRPGRRVVRVPGPRPAERPAELVETLFPDLVAPADTPMAGPSGHPSVTLLDFDPDGEDKVIAAICAPLTGDQEEEVAAPGRPARGGGAAGPCCGPTSASAPTGGTGPGGRSSAPGTGSTSSPTTAPSATCSATGC